MQRYFAQRAQINALHSQIKDAKSALEEAKRDLARWNDPTYIASQARTRLHFVFPGERQYAVIGLPDSANKNDAPAADVSKSDSGRTSLVFTSGRNYLSNKFNKVDSNER
jgi:hypothetical protein